MAQSDRPGAGGDEGHDALVERADAALHQLDHLDAVGVRGVEEAAGEAELDQDLAEGGDDHAQHLGAALLGRDN